MKKGLNGVRERARKKKRINDLDNEEIEFVITESSNNQVSDSNTKDDALQLSIKELKKESLNVKK